MNRRPLFDAMTKYGIALTPDGRVYKTENNAFNHSDSAERCLGEAALEVLGEEVVESIDAGDSLHRALTELREAWEEVWVPVAAYFVDALRDGLRVVRDPRRLFRPYPRKYKIKGLDINAEAMEELGFHFYRVASAMRKSGLSFRDGGGFIVTNPNFEPGTPTTLAGTLTFDVEAKP